MALLHETYSVKSFVVRMSRTQHERQEPFFHSAGPSLIGMEKPVPSFQQFLESVPPPPLKELPPIPFFKDTVPMSTRPIPQSNTTDRISTVSSTASWWENDEEKPLDRRLEPEPEPEPSRESPIFLQPSTYTVSSPQLAKPERPLPPLLEPRTFSPLLDSPLVSPSRGAARDNAPAFEYELSAEFPQTDHWPRPPSAHYNGVTKGTPAGPYPSISSIAKDFALQGPQTPLPKTPDELGQAKERAAAQLAERSDLDVTENKIPGKAIVSLGLEAVDTSDKAKHGHQSSAQIPPRSPEYAHYIPSQRQEDSAQEWTARSADLKGEVEMKDERLSKDYHQALLDQYRELARPETALFDDDSWFVQSDIGTGRDIHMAPQPLFTDRRMETQHRRVDSADPTSPVSAHEEKEKGETKGRHHHRRKSSLRDQIKDSISSGPLKMILPSKYPRADTPASPLSPTRPDTEKAKDASKEKKNKKGKKATDGPPHTPPLPLTLVASLSSKSSSPRPSTDSNRPRPSTESRHASPLAHSHHLTTEPRQSTPLTTISQTSSASPIPSASPTTTSRPNRTTLARLRRPSANPHSPKQSPTTYHQPSANAIYPLPMERAPSDPSPPPPPSTHPFTLGNLSKLSIAAPAHAASPLPSPSPPTSPDSVVSQRLGLLRHGDGERRWSFSKRAGELKREGQRARRRAELKSSIKIVGQTDPARLDGYV
ncbi:hypothetical protein K490DRAFT_67548 [Saccharata proteae CBS 121410]|uniref:Uncharacterized protein n=1 Tax=Saccharata proteae CBS 121410 TaxID=1314787 RepID=A0A9P4LX17_9PEZI|nr:hypothetical protein K490DRAFT_67548 [Saccharata proteae CBS 121410]